MILEFCVSNYLSIKDELKISFVATALEDVLTESNDMITVPDTGLSVLRSAVIYGANASGKSNVLKAISFCRRFITDSFKNSQAGESIAVENFRLNTTSMDEPTTMEQPLLLKVTLIVMVLRLTAKLYVPNGCTSVQIKREPKKSKYSTGQKKPPFIRRVLY